MSTIQLDRALFAAVNGHVGQSPALDDVMLFCADAPFVKLGLVLMLLIGLWFGRSETAARARIVAGIVGTFAALSVARILQNMLPPSPRPVNGFVGVHIAPGMDVAGIQDWSSFPSDHAALALGLATIVWLLSKRLGLIAVLWALVVVCFPRVYLGYHYPSDILVGALLGVLCVVAADRLVAERLQKVVTCVERVPQIFYPLAFSLMFMMGTLFDDVRNFGTLVKTVVSDSEHQSGIVRAPSSPIGKPGFHAISHALPSGSAT